MSTLRSSGLGRRHPVVPLVVVAGLAAGLLVVVSGAPRVAGQTGPEEPVWDEEAPYISKLAGPGDAAALTPLEMLPAPTRLTEVTAGEEKVDLSLAGELATIDEAEASPVQLRWLPPETVVAELTDPVPAVTDLGPDPDPDPVPAPIPAEPPAAPTTTTHAPTTSEPVESPPTQAPVTTVVTPPTPPIEPTRRGVGDRVGDDDERPADRAEPVVQRA